jgi:tetratricopeptide (TPR) repeat protein
VIIDENSEVVNEGSGTYHQPSHQRTEASMALGTKVDEKGHTCLDHYENRFDWSVVDVIGSPRLMKPFGALTIEACGYIPDLDLTATEFNGRKNFDSNLLDLSDAFESVDTDTVTALNRPSLAPHLPQKNNSHPIVSSKRVVFHRVSKQRESWLKASLQYELCAFPTISTVGITHPKWHSSATPSLTESECLAKFRRLEKLHVAEIPTLVSSIWRMAGSLEDNGQYILAERWFCRVITAKKRIPGFRPQETLDACLKVVDLRSYMGGALKARALHRYLHQEILRVLGEGHELTAESKSVRAVYEEGLMTTTDEETIKREVLQRHLTTLGMNHLWTIDALHNLGSSLSRQEMFDEAEIIFITVIQLLLRAASSSDRYNPNASRLFDSMLLLFRTRLSQRKYAESENLFEHIGVRFKDLLESDGNPTHQYHFYFAMVYFSQKRERDCERKLRMLLQNYGHSMNPSLLSNAMVWLGKLALNAGRKPESVCWYQKALRLRVEAYGLPHRDTISRCRDLGFCYAAQRDYQDAISLFQKIIERLAHEDYSDLEIRKDRIQELEDYISEIREMSAKDIMMDEGQSKRMTESEDAGTEGSGMPTSISG